MKKTGNGHALDEGILNRIAQALNQAERPILIIGGGVKLSGACQLITELIERGTSPS